MIAVIDCFFFHYKWVQASAMSISEAVSTRKIVKLQSFSVNKCCMIGCIRDNIPGDPEKSTSVCSSLTLYWGGGGVFHQVRGFLPITLEVIKVNSQNLVTFPKI